MENLDQQLQEASPGEPGDIQASSTSADSGQEPIPETAAAPAAKATTGSKDQPATKPSTAPSSTRKPEATLIERMHDRLNYANQVLSNFEALRHEALLKKVPMPYQKRWQVDSNSFFVMGVRTLARIKRLEAKKKG